MTHSFLSNRRIIGLVFIVLGVVALASSFFLAASWAWPTRMIAFVLVVGGAQWQPPIEQWLERSAYTRPIVGAVCGLCLVGMLLLYSIG